MRPCWLQQRIPQRRSRDHEHTLPTHSDIKTSCSSTATAVMSLPSLPNEDYTVGWICALPLERAAAEAMLDEVHDKPRKQLSNDHNLYTLGRINEHNVVVACLPAGVYGTNPAAAVATQMLFSFECIKVGLMVGIGGGIPNGEKDIRMGDVVVSKPGGMFGGVVQYDRGKTLKDRFERTGSLNKPPPVLLAAVSAMEAKHMMRENRISEFLEDMERKHPKMQEKFSCPGAQHDPFSAMDSHHLDDDNANESYAVRNPKYRSPVVHYGLIASGNQVIKDAATRDQLREELGVDLLCFEMEAAGLMDTFPCVVIRGISDYADYRKNDLWQGYAAATSAACAKELLSIMPGGGVAVTPTPAEVTGESVSCPIYASHAVMLNLVLVSSNLTKPVAPSPTACFTVPFERDVRFIGREDIFTEIHKQFKVRSRVALAGIGGVG